MSFQIGERIGGRYEIHGIAGGAGRSGMGTVYVCYDHQGEGALALKTYQEGFFNDKALVDHFKRGALAWIELHRHPNIVRAHGVHEIGQRLFLALEYVAPDEARRNTLTHHLREPIGTEQALRWGIEFCDGMEHARVRGVTPHRDIKPDNLMIAHDGTLKVSDFDLAGLLDHDVAVGADDSVEGAPGLTFVRVEAGRYVAGTPPWMAPEQFLGETSVASNLYSFGVVAYQMVSGGRRPVDAGDDGDWARAHAQQVPEPIDSPLWPVIETCLAKQPEARFGEGDRERGLAALRAALVDLWRREVPATEAPAAPVGDELEAHNHCNKGASLTALGLYQEAIQEYKQALAHEPDDAVVYLNAGVALAKKGDLTNAERSYRKAIHLDPELAEAHNNHGVTLDLKGEIEAAEAAFRRAIALDARLIGAYQNIGVLLSNCGRHDEAIALMREAVARDATNGGYHYSLGVSLEKAGQARDAMASYEEAIRLRPRDGAYRYALGNAWRLLGDMDRAVGSWKDAAALDPTHAMCRFSLGIAHEQVSELAGAYRYYREAIEADPTTPNAYYNLGLLLAKTGLYGEGADLFERFLVHMTPDLAAHESRAREYVDKMRADEATVTEQIVEHPEAVYNRGRAYLNLGRLDEARAWLERALTARPSYSAALTALGVYHERRGEYAQSADCHRRAIEADPADALPWNNLGWVHYLAGRYDDALAAYARYIESAPPEQAQWVEGAQAVVAEMRAKLAAAPATPCEPQQAAAPAAQAPAAPINAVLDAFNAGDHDGGLAMLTQMAKQAGSAEAHNLLGEEYASRGRHDEALDAYFEALALAPQDGRALINIGRAFVGKGEYQNAVGHYGDMREQFGNDPVLLRHLGDAHRLGGDHGAAVEVYRQSIAADPGNAVAHCHLGLSIDALGRRKEAMSAYRAAIGHDPENDVAHYHLGLALETMNFADLACESFRAFLECAKPGREDWVAHARAAVGGEAAGRVATG